MHVLLGLVQRLMSGRLLLRDCLRFHRCDLAELTSTGPEQGTEFINETGLLMHNLACSFPVCPELHLTPRLCSCQGILLIWLRAYQIQRRVTRGCNSSMMEPCMCVACKLLAFGARSGALRPSCRGLLGTL